MQRIILPIISMLFFVFYVSSFAQFLPDEGFALNGNGARAAGMGYAFTGIADDASAISWNPAGLTQLQSMEASIVGRMGFGSGSIDFPKDEYVPIDAYSSGSYYYIDVIGIDSWDIERGSQFKLNFASFVFPFQLGENNVVGGIAYRNLYDFTSETTYNLSGMFEEWQYDSFGNYLGSTSYGDVETNEFIAYTGGINAISPSLGFQLNDMFSIGTTINILTGSMDGEYKYDVADINIVDGDWSMDFSGTAIDLGVLVRPAPTFSIGANVNLGHTITGEVEGEEGDIEVPTFFSIGGAFRATENLLMAFDYRSRPWSSAEDEDGDEMFLEDANSIHAGLEYLVMAGNNAMPLRLGFYTMPLPAQDYNEDQITANVLTAGVGIIMGNIILDGAFEYGMTSFSVGETSDGKSIDQNQNDFRVSVGAVMHFNQ